MKKHLMGVLALLITVAGPLTACSTTATVEASPSLAAAGPGLSPKARAACERVLARTMAPSAEDLVVVVDATSSVADLPLPPGLVADLRQASQRGGSLSLIAVDGARASSRLVAKRVALSTPGPRDRPSVAKLASVIPSCVQAVYADRLAPTSPGTDLHRALALAAELLGPKGTLWVVSDWLSNTGQLDLDADLLSGDPAAAARQAARRAPVDLRGATLKSAGIADASTPMLSANRQWMLRFVRDLCTTWGARGCDSLDLDPVNPERHASGLPEDRVPPFPGVATATSRSGCTVEIPASLAFAGGSAALAGSAGEVLDVPLRLLRDNPRAEVTIVGHTASSSAYTQRQLLALSRDRAAAVKAWLVDHGIRASRIATKGVGDTEPRVEDIDRGTGRQIPRMAALERRVDLTVGGAPCSR